jgi:glucan phosphoethanolaminetransferase (alkaline phosphatase superfamily)
LIFFQILNILSNEFETGTQGSIDGYIISFYIGILLSIAIILIQIFQKNYLNKVIKIVYFILLLCSFSLYIINFKFLYYVTIIGYSISDVIVNSMKYDIAEISKDNAIEKIYPIIVYLIITINVIICFINIFQKRDIE